MTKIFIPSSSHSLILRPRLMDLLNKGMQVSVTLVSAPTGFGKTTLLSSWVQSLPQEHPYVAWLSLDEGDNEPLSFWIYVLTALDNQLPGLFAPLLAAIRASQTLSLQYILQSLINTLINKSEQILLILDDYHLITQAEVHTSLQYLIEHIPPQLHIMLATRTDPPLPLIRWQAHRLVQEIRADQLRCTNEEAVTFLKEVMSITLPEDLIESVTSRTEGWLVGLQLLGLSLQGHANPVNLLEEISGSQRYILDFLTEEVLQQQPPEIQSFLLQSSILEQLNASLCNAVLQQGHSQQLLEWLDHANLFVVSLDSQRRWYRYHALFAEMLRYHLERTQSELLPVLHHRASHWYAENNRITEAILHAFIAQEWQWAAELIERLPFSTLWVAGGHERIMLHHWIEQFPMEIMHTHPRLCLACAQVMRAVAQQEKIESWLDAAESTLTTSLNAQQTSTDTSSTNLALDTLQEQKNLLGEVLTFRAWLQSIYMEEDGQSNISLCQRALTLLSEQNLIHRAQIEYAQVLTYFNSSANDVSAAVKCGLQASSLAQTAGNVALAIFYMGTTAYYMEVEGRLSEAEQLAKKALQLVNKPTGISFPEVGWPSIFQADILREWNRLDEALDLALQGVSLGKQTGSLQFLICAYTVLMRVYLSRGELDKAHSVYLQIERHRINTNPYLYIYICSLFFIVDQVKLWIACNDLDLAISWVDRLEKREKPGTPYIREREEVACIRLLLAQEQPSPALQRLAPLLLRASTGKRLDHVIELWLLQALAYQQLRQEQQALDALNQAVQLGEPERYVRRFVDEGPPMALLLSKLRSQRYKHHPSLYLDMLISAFPHADQTVISESQHLQSKSQPLQSKSQPLLDPLSEREMEVLSLLDQGISNQQIADQLVVSVNTVKRHTSNIFAKLETTNRLQACTRARTLGLLPR
jgi:LuxR family transcriptional regulator, maltose regulon positive regulatory protein